MVKIILLGNSGVGKTKILQRFIERVYENTTNATLGVDFRVKVININGVNLKMTIWDTAGQERFKSITPSYFKGAAGIVLVYSVTDYKTFIDCEDWIKQIKVP